MYMSVCLCQPSANAATHMTYGPINFSLTLALDLAT